jgi:Sec-independent protein translocase protein TatA
MRGLGAGIREFNNAKNAINNEIKECMKEADRKALESEKEK